MEEIRLVNLAQTSPDAFQKHLADVVILTSQNKVLLQHRPLTWQTSPGRVNLFGGHVEDGEQPIEGAVREIHEETGGVLSPNDLVFIGTITEGWTNHTEAVHVYFWHDKSGSITGCYEAESIEFDTGTMEFLDTDGRVTRSIEYREGAQVKEPPPAKQERAPASVPGMDRQR